MLTIFKGDDTGGTLGKHIAITVTTEVPLTNCVLVFNYCGAVREFANVVSGQTIEVFFSHNETRTFPVGTNKAALAIRDASGKVRTLTNALPIKVTTNLEECYGPQSQTADVSIRAVANWSDIINKPFVGKVVNLKTDDDMLAAVGTIVEQLGGTVNA